MGGDATGALPVLRRSDSIALKNYTKWQSTPSTATHPIGGFVPMKLPYDAAMLEDRHSVLDVKAQFPAVGLILDLQNQDNPYSVEGTEVRRTRVPHESKQIPSDAYVQRFRRAANAFWAQPANANALIAVHCHYGFNRTGFVIVSYLVEEKSWSLEEALSQFAECRSPGIRHAHFRGELRIRYDPRVLRRRRVVQSLLTAAACWSLVKILTRQSLL
mmetsp:Transcript_4597/g.13671  ORF Transcript_4597/g.13671 Transcript_4597/m.13671 type:complete len:216 (-) Transcript_4597:106-753(-)